MEEEKGVEGREIEINRDRKKRAKIQILYANSEVHELCKIEKFKNNCVNM
jgi:hypothetical protein